MRATETPLRGHAPGVTASVAELVALRGAARGLFRGEPLRTQAPLAGPHRSAARGRGMEFDEVRAYQPGDDARGIDWRVTARRGRVYSKVFHEERERPVWLLADLSPSMQFGTRGAFKSVAAARAAALAAWSARESGDRVGALVRSSAGVAAFAPRPAHFLPILAGLARATTTLGDAPSEELARSAARLCGQVQRGSQVIVLSDFYELSAALERELSQLAARCELHCVLVYDGLEAAPPPPGRYRVSDGDEVHAIATGAAAWRRAYAEPFAARRSALRAFGRRHRASVLLLRTDRDPAAVLADALVPRPRIARRAA